MQNKRENAFDILRIISMFLVIIVHVSNVYGRSFDSISHQYYFISLIFNTISRVCVPIFFMISGALLLDRKFDKTKYWKRLLKYFLIIVVWDMVYLYWEYFFEGNVYRPLYKLLFEPYRAHLWFLYTIIIIYAVQPLLKWILDKSNRVVKIALLVAWLFLSIYSLWNQHISDYFTTFCYIGYFILGKYWYDFTKKHITKKQNLIELAIILIGFIISIYLNYKISIEKNMFYKLYFAYRCPLIMFPSFALFSLVITNYQKEKLSSLGMILSEVSLGVYLIHGVFLDIFIKYLPYQKMNPIYSIPIISILIFILSVVAVYLLKKIKPLKEIM